MEPLFHSGFVALIGRPNVGKSTLLNSMIGRKVTITSSKPQTTRQPIAGVLTTPGHQLILLDMPGFQRPRDELTRRMQQRLEETLSEVDVVLFLLDASDTIGSGDRFIAGVLAAAGTPMVVALNKVDLLDPKGLHRQLELARTFAGSARVYSVSARCGRGVETLQQELERLLPEGPLYFPPGMITDKPEEFLVAEFIREKAIRATEEEVPHAIAVEILEMEPRRGREMVYVAAVIYVERESQRPIVLGEGGRRLKSIGSEARQDIEWLLGCRVFLDLRVKVRRGWRGDPAMLQRLGL